MENKQKKLRLKLNIFDIIIIAVVIVAAGALLYVWRFSDKNDTTAATKPVHYTIELTGMLSGTSEKIHVGDTIMDGTKKFIMGTVLSVTPAPATTPETNRETGDTVLSVIPDKEAVLIELESNCSTTDSQITAESGYVIRIGTEVKAVGPGYAGMGFIVAIDREVLGQ